MLEEVESLPLQLHLVVLLLQLVQQQHAERLLVHRLHVTVGVMDCESRCPPGRPNSKCFMGREWFREVRQA